MSNIHAYLTGANGKTKCWLVLTGDWSDYGSLTVTCTSLHTGRVTIGSVVSEGTVTREGKTGAGYSVVATAANGDANVDVVLEWQVSDASEIIAKYAFHLRKVARL